MAETLTGPDWLLRDRHVTTGMDQLGIQVVSINIYGDLLPGITNVTDRARYFSLYPWVLQHFFGSLSGTSNQRLWRNWIRSLDFTYALTCAADELRGERRAQAVVGVEAARREVQRAGPAGAVDVHSWSHVDEKGRVPSGAYFKNTEGGFGQYYRVPLEVLGIVLSDENHRFPDRALTDYAGVPLAESVDQESAFGDLIEIARGGSATVSELAAVGARVHPQAIATGSDEQRLLRHLVLGTDPNICQGQTKSTRTWRPASLRLILHHFAAGPGRADTYVEDFRWSVLTGRRSDGRPWDIPEQLATVRSAWAGYQRNEALNHAIETLFWAGLTLLEGAALTPSELADQLAEIAIEQCRAALEWPAVPATVADFVAACRPAGGAFATWDALEERHRRLSAAVVQRGDAQVAAGLAIAALGALAGDMAMSEANPFAGIPVQERLLQAFEVHVEAWRRRTRERSTERLAPFLVELLLDWIIYRHLRVATRKLAGEGLSTFKFRPEEGRLVLLVDEIPRPALTAPRLRTSIRILADLGLLEIRETGVTTTPDGVAVLEANA